MLVEPLVKVPETAFEDCVPLAIWPEVLTYNFFGSSLFSVGNRVRFRRGQVALR
jgi:hypothetical protein